MLPLLTILLLLYVAVAYPAVALAAFMAMSLLIGVFFMLWIGVALLRVLFSKD